MTILSNLEREYAVKKLPELSERMKAVAGMVSKGSRIADIGCDHGYVSIYLYNSGISQRCIAADVKEGPLRAAKKNIGLFGASDGVEARLSDGLKSISRGEFDCILISGMGGGLITEILAYDKEKTASAKELILEPQSDADKVRKYLYGNGFSISKEILVTERGKYYPVIKAVHSTVRKCLSEEEYVYGPCLIKEKTELFVKYLNKEQKRIESVISKLEVSDSKNADERLCCLRKELRSIKKIWKDMKE